MKTAAIYARVSSDKQREENTIASQTAALVAFAREHRFAVPPEWVFKTTVIAARAWFVLASNGCAISPPRD